MDKSLCTKCLGRRGFPCWCDKTEIEDLETLYQVMLPEFSSPKVPENHLLSPFSLTLHSNQNDVCSMH